MAIIILPDITAAGITMHLVRGDTTLEYMGGNTGVIQNTKAIWAMTFPLPPKKTADARAWQAALVQLAKPANQFRITPPGWQRGVTYTGNIPLVNGAGQLGTSLNLSNMPPNTPIALAGDYFDVNGEMKMLIADLTSGGTGLATAEFEPAFRDSPPTLDAVEFNSPRVTMRKLAPQASWRIALGDFYGMSIDAVEHY